MSPPAAGQRGALAGQPSRRPLLDVGALVTAYFARVPDPTVPSERVAFGTSGHRGSAFDGSFNEHHVLAITQAVCDHRRGCGITGPLFLGIDTHALSRPACATALSVLAANGVDVVLAADDGYTPTPAISHAIVKHNRCGTGTIADGIVLTPSHNPPRDGGFKYNPPHGGPAGLGVTDAVEAAANAYLDARLRGVRRMPVEQARAAATTHRHDYLGNYVEDLGDVVDLAAVRAAGVRIGVDPMGGAGVAYWPAIAERWRLDLTVIDDSVDPTFAFVAPGADGIVRMDPASAHAMRRLIAVRDRFDIALACDTDHDRHGIVTPAAGLLPADHFLVVAIDHLFRHRPCWPATAAIGKTVVSTWMIDRVAAELGRRVHEVPVGFKWFSAGLCDAGLGFAGEESAGASFLRRDGTAWTTDKDGIAAALLAAEILAVGGRDPGARYRALTERLGDPVAGRIDAPATAAQKDRLAKLSSASIDAVTLAGEPVTAVRDRALGNGALIGGVQVVSAHGWYVARASGTEHLYKIYAESFFGADHLRCILDEARTVVDAALSTATLAPNGQHDRNDSGATGRRAASAV